MPRLLPLRGSRYRIICRKTGGLMRLKITLAALLIGGAAPAAAHPHMFVDTGVEVIFDDQGRAAALRITWIYDDLTSLGILSDRGMDEDFDGVLTPEELAALSGFDMQWDAGFDGDTYALQAAAPLALSGPSDWTASYSEAKLSSTHLRRFAAPVVIASQPLVVQTYDPSYYVAYAIVAQTVLTDGPACTAETFAPDRAAADAILQASISEMAGGGDAEGDFPAIGAAYADEVRITCVAPS